LLGSLLAALLLVQFETSKGSFVVEVHPEWAPLGAARFEQLVGEHFFDGQKFFRVRKGYIAQFGLHPKPRVIARWKGRRIADDPVKQTNARGTLAYAMTGPGTRSTQIYINLKDNPHLDEQGFAPFGRIVEGIDVIDQLYAGYDETAGGGMRAGRQGPIEKDGNAYLDRNFPLLDFIRRARVVKTVTSAPK
jgi:homoserine O-acetyltransferase